MKKVRVFLAGDEAALHKLREAIKSPKVGDAEVHPFPKFYTTITHHQGTSFARPIYIDELRTRLQLHLASKPPKAAGAALFFIAPKHQREAFLGDLEEDFQECSRKFGRRAANFYCWWSVCRSAAVCFGPAVVRIIKEFWG